MASIDHVAVETARPRETAAFYERVLGARIVAEAGHPVMAYLGATGSRSTSRPVRAATPPSA